MDTGNGKGGGISGSQNAALLCGFHDLVLLLRWEQGVQGEDRGRTRQGRARHGAEGSIGRTSGRAGEGRGRVEGSKAQPATGVMHSQAHAVPGNIQNGPRQTS